MEKQKIDYSTLNERVIKTLRPYVKPESYTIGSLGVACAGDPAGYPSYFVRSVYTRFGNEPSKGTKEVIEYNGKLYALPDFWVGSKNYDDYRAKRDRLYKRLYNVLPEDHPRIIAWINATYTHLKHCYHDASATDSHDQVLIYPVPYYKLKTPRVDFKRWSVDYIMQYCKEIADSNWRVQFHGWWIATIDNHMAVRAIREFYPDHQPTDQLLNRPDPVGTWWEYYPEQPNKHTCAGDPSMGKHPMNSPTYCQVCKWDAKHDVTWKIVDQNVRHYRWMDGLS